MDQGEGPRIARVLLPLPLPEAFDYAVPTGLALGAGDHVAAPLGPRLVRGVVMDVRDGAGGNRPMKSSVPAGSGGSSS